jgi:hypothetical protein
MDGITKTAGRLAAVGAVALLLAEAAAPAEARTRSQGVRKVSIVAQNCAKLRGPPFTFDAGEDIVLG